MPLVLQVEVNVKQCAVLCVMCLLYCDVLDHGFQCACRASQAEIGRKMGELKELRRQLPSLQGRDKGMGHRWVRANMGVCVGGGASNPAPCPLARVQGRVSPGCPKTLTTSKSVAGR